MVLLLCVVSQYLGPRRAGQERIDYPCNLHWVPGTFWLERINEGDIYIYIHTQPFKNI